MCKYDNYFFQIVDVKRDILINGVCKSHLKLNHLDVAQLSPLQTKCHQLDEKEKGKESTNEKLIHETQLP